MRIRILSPDFQTLSNPLPSIDLSRLLFLGLAIRFHETIIVSQKQEDLELFFHYGRILIATVP